MHRPRWSVPNFPTGVASFTAGLEESAIPQMRGQLTVAGPSLGIRYASENSAVVLEPWEALGKQPWACASHDGHPNLPSRSLIILVGAFLFAAVDWLELNHRLAIIFKCAILAAGGIAIAEQLLP